MARWLLASSLAERGQFSEGLTHGQEGLRIAEEIRHPYSLILMCWGLALLYTLEGELSHAVVHLERALALCRDWTVPVLSPVTTGFLGYLHVLSGRAVEGLSELERGEKEQGASGLALYHSRLVLWRGEALMRADRLDEAQAQAERARALTRERGERGLEAWALWLLAEIATRREPSELGTAEGHYHQALRLADEDGLCPLLARCHSGLGRLHRRLGQRTTAQEHFSMATAMYRLMNMRSLVEQAETELASLS
jgi:tetratricopeptide (TPR) repeat protein